MLMPKRVKHRKQFKQIPSGKAHKAIEVNFGQYGLKALQSQRLTAQQIEAARVAISRSTKRQGKVWIRVFPHIPVTKKPAETRMGTGKGSPEYYAAMVRAGEILFELDGVSRSVAEDAMRLASHKLPMRTRFVERLGD
jgi:large subunit ribosomal protein L16